MSEDSQNHLFDDPLGLSRIASLSDGVFAIVITLLAFDLKLPPNTAPDQVLARVLELGPKYVSYIASFFVVSIYWVGHHAMYRHIKRYDRTLLWLNIVFLMAVSIIPFPTSILGSFPTEQTAVVLYSTGLIFCGSTLALVWRHASRDRRLVDSALPAQVIKIAYQRIMAAPAVASIAAIVSCFSARLALALILVSGALYLFPSRLDRISSGKS